MLRSPMHKHQCLWPHCIPMLMFWAALHTEAHTYLVSVILLIVTNSFSTCAVAATLVRYLSCSANPNWALLNGSVSVMDTTCSVLGWLAGSSELAWAGSSAAIGVGVQVGVRGLGLGLGLESLSITLLPSGWGWQALQKSQCPRQRLVLA